MKIFTPVSANKVLHLLVVKMPHADGVNIFGAHNGLQYLSIYIYSTWEAGEEPFKALKSCGCICTYVQGESFKSKSTHCAHGPRKRFKS